MEDQNQTSMIGQVIGGRYRLTKLLGEGGMGAVYAAEHINITKTVAVKLLHPEISSNQEAVARFRQEAQSASSIGHPNIIGIDDFFTMDDGRVCLIMEFLNGDSLSDRMLVPGGLPPEIAIDLMVQVCEGLAAAHEKGIIHRDMKPENVFIANVHGKEIVKILDFGIAKVTGNDDNNLTKTGTVFGTPHYMSPEQALGHKVDARADVYSMGVMLFEIFTGQVPFQAESFMGVLSQHITKPIPSPSTMTPGRPVPPMMDDIIMTAMAKEVDKRFSTMNALKGALDAFKEALTGANAPQVVTGRVNSQEVAAAVAVNSASQGIPKTMATGPGQAPITGPGAPPATNAPVTGPGMPQNTPIPKTMMASTQERAAAGASTAVTPPMVYSEGSKKKSKAGLIIGLVIAFIVLGGGGAAAAVFWDDIMGKDDGGDEPNMLLAKTDGGSAQVSDQHVQASVDQSGASEESQHGETSKTAVAGKAPDTKGDKNPKTKDGDKTLVAAKGDDTPKQIDPVAKNDPPKDEPKDSVKDKPKDPPPPQDCTVTLSTSPTKASIFRTSGGFRIGRTPKKFKLDAGETRKLKLSKHGYNEKIVTLSCDRQNAHFKLKKGFKKQGTNKIPGIDLN